MEEFIKSKKYGDGYTVYSDGKILGKRGNKFLKPTLTKGYPSVIICDGTGDRELGMGCGVSI